jgi:hypothetical protein
MIATATIKKSKFDAVFFAEIIAAIDSTEKKQASIPQLVAVENRNAQDSFFASRGMMQSFCPAESISARLDAIIEAGAAFDVAENDFEVVGAERLTEEQRQYLTANEKPVLGTLHQRLLCKHLFNDSKELLETFAFEIYEREAVLAEAKGFYDYETYFDAVSAISRKWFAQLLEATTE